MSNEEKLERIIGDYCERLDRGERLDAAAICAAHPDVAAELRARLAALRIVEHASEAELPQGTPEQIGDYRLLREIGRGGMGVVYEAEQGRLRRRVALKVLSLGITGTPHAVKRFQREARAAAALHHTNIVPVYDLDQHAGQWYYAMELVQGRALSSIVRELASRPSEEDLAQSVAVAAPRTRTDALTKTGTGERAYFVRVAELFAGVADALEFAHQEGIVHRDVKPSNLLLDADGVLKIVDFGLARFDTEGPSMTVTGDLLGTPAYMSPEQAMAKRMGIDHRTDIYSLGATLYELVTLGPPFEAESLQQLCSQIMTKDPILPRRRNRHVPRDLETIVCKAMEKDRDKRYQTAREMARDLRLFADGGAIHARRIGPAGRAWRKVKRHKVRSALAASVLLFGAVGTVLAVQNARAARLRAAHLYATLLGEAHAATASVFDGIDDSVPLFAEAIGLLPERPEAYVGRAVLTCDRTPDERLADLEDARRRGISGRAYHLARARIHQLCGEWRRAEEERKRARGLPPEGPFDNLLEGRLAAVVGDHDAAESHFDRAVDGSTRDNALRLLALRSRALVRERNGNLHGALADLHAAAGAGDRSLGTRARIAWIWSCLGFPERGRDQLTILMDEARSEKDWMALWRATAGGRTAWHDEVMDRAVEALPSSVRILVRQSLSGRDPEETLRWAKKCIDVAPDDPDALTAYAVALCNVGRHADALAAIRSALHREPRSVHAHRVLAWIHYQSDSLDEALETLEHAERLNPTDPYLHNLRSKVLRQLGQPEEALESSDRALRLRPTLSFLRVHRARVLFDLERFAEVVRECDEVLRVEPDYAAAHYERGRGLLKLGENNEALEALDQAVALRPDDAEYYRYRAVVLHSLRRIDDALASVDRALELGELGAAHSWRASLLLDLRRSEEALAAADRALEILGRQYKRPIRRRLLAGAHAMRSLALADLGRPEEALKAARTAVDLAPNEHDASVSLSLALARTGRHDEAIAELGRRHASGDLPDAWFHYNRGILLSKTGRSEEALASYDRAIEHDPGFPEAHANRAVMLKRLGRLEDALASIDRALALDRSLQARFGAGSWARSADSKTRSPLSIVPAPGDPGSHDSTPHAALRSWRWADGQRRSTRSSGPSRSATRRPSR